MNKIITHSSEETRKLGFNLAHEVSSGAVALIGDLGSGKTTFTQGFAEGLGIKDKILSPTFVLIRQHPIPKSKKTLFHIDLYRLENINLTETGIQEIISDPKNIILIEWAEKIKKQLPKNSLRITFKNLGDNKREITLSYLV